MFNSKQALPMTVTIILLAAFALGAVPLVWAQEDRLPQNHALVIGINRYIAEIENVRELEFAAPDAERITEILDQRGWDARKIINEEATRDRIVLELSRLAREAKEQDSVLIYFAGHGVVDKTGREHTYWLTHTATLANLAVKGIRLTHLLEYIHDIPAGRKLLILDHCHSGDVEKVVGTAIEGTRAASGELRVSRNLFPKERFTKRIEERFTEGLAVLGAARVAAYEFKELGHGMFTYGLIEALTKPETDTNNDRFLSLSEIWAYAEQKLRETAARKGVSQEPIELVRGQGMLNWNIIDAPGGDPGQTALEVVKIINDIDLSAPLDPRVKAACFEAVGRWKEAKLADREPTTNDSKIVEELKGIGTLVSLYSWSTMKSMLESKVRALGVVQ